MDAPFQKQGPMILDLWNELVGLAEKCAGDYPGVRTAVLAAGAANLQMPLKHLPKIPRKDHNDALRKEAAFRTLFENESTSVQHVSAVMELMDKMHDRIYEIVFVWSHGNGKSTECKKRTEGSSKRKKIAKAKDIIKPVIVAFGLLIPSSRAFMDWLPVILEGWKEGKEGTNFPALEQLRSNKGARQEVMKQEGRRKARSLNAAYRAAFTVVHNDRSDGEESDGDGSGEEDEDSDCSAAEGTPLHLDLEEASPKESKKIKELDPAYCKGFVARIVVNPLIQRLNTTAAKTSEHPILMQDIFRDMTSAWTLVNVNKLVMQIVTGMEGVNIDTAGLLGHITEEGAKANADAAEYCIQRTDIDMSEKRRELCRATAFRLGVFAMLEGAIKETNSLNDMPGVPRQMALANSKFAKKVKTELSGLKCGVIVSNYFEFQETIAELAAENKKLKAEKAASAAASEAIFGAEDEGYDEIFARKIDMTFGADATDGGRTPPLPESEGGLTDASEGSMDTNSTQGSE